jgi:predicted DNA-binding protein (MmcQ/YjbR family)
VQWGEHLVFKVAGKMFAILALEPGGNWLTVKCTPEEFAELVERPGIGQAPYCAKTHWVALEAEDTVAVAEVRRLLERSYDLVVAKMPKSKQAALKRKA